MSGPRYDLPAIALHWLQAALVLWLLWLGWTMVDLPKGAERSAAYGLHKSLGLCALLLTGLRAAWRWRHPAPPALVAGRAAVLAALAHRALYGLLFLVPLAGYLASSFTPYAMKFFGLPLPAIGWPDPALNGACKLVHQVAGWALATLIVLHVVAALHHGMRRDGTLSRMWPGRVSSN